MYRAKMAGCDIFYVTNIKPLACHDHNDRVLYSDFQDFHFILALIQFYAS